MVVAIDKKKKRPSSINPSLESQNPNADFILAKLERDMTSPIKASMRASMDGKGMLQAEFETARKSSEDREVRSSKADAIDWDFWGNVMNDYGTFAKEQSTRLAKAIEAGIPATLRGMYRSASKDAELEQLYANLLKETSPHEKAISRDLASL
ncbi:6072_t:CDS:2, partial [Acaulospora colombiana]